MMKIIPQELLRKFDERMIAKQIPIEVHPFNRKWLRYYLDFCDKYRNDPRDPGSLPDFINKLRERNQPKPYQKQAYHSVLIYYEMLGIRPGWLEKKALAIPVQEPITSYESGRESLHDLWQPAYQKLSNEIKVRHYSPKTYKAYSNWVRKFQQFLKVKPPDALEVEDVKAFLTYLAVEQKVSASSQNQAFNALLFFFRHILKKEFGKVEGVVRAKRKPYIPVVLSRSEIDMIIGKLRYPYDLVVKLLYGCGLRLGEYMNISADQGGLVSSPDRRHRETYSHH